jgi:ABC-type branched-subunit amino acid transport system substrate-binding protein
MVIAPFTLPAAPMKANFNAVQVQAALQNAKGGIDGHRVVVIGCDDQNDPNVAASCASQAVSAHVAAMLGMFSIQSASIWPILDTAKIPSIGILQLNPVDLQDPNAWAIDTPSSTAMNAFLGAYLVSKEGCRKVASVTADIGPGNKGPIAAFQYGVTAAGGTYVGPSLIPASTSAGDFGPLAANVLNKTNCVVVNAGYASTQIIQALYQLNPHVKVTTTDTGIGPGWAQALGPAATVVTQLSATALTTSSAPGVVEYLQQMKAKSPGAQLNAFSEQAWASWYAFYNVASTIHGDINAATLDAALSKATSISTDGITAPVDFAHPEAFEGLPRTFSTYVVIARAVNGKVIQQGKFVNGMSFLTK